ncbi:hypothetical protein D3C76_1801920 [compost metagenome]
MFGEQLPGRIQLVHFHSGELRGNNGLHTIALLVQLLQQENQLPAWLSGGFRQLLQG